MDDFYFLCEVKKKVKTQSKICIKIKLFLPQPATEFPKIIANTNYRYLTCTLVFCFLISDYESKEIILHLAKLFLKQMRDVDIFRIEI